MSRRRYALARFPTEGALLEAARALRGEGRSGLDLHTPVPVHGAEEALGLSRSVVPRIALAAGLIGAATGYLMQWWMVGVDFPINVGGRPPHSPPAFIPVTFELGVLFAALSIFFGLFVLWGLPALYHPVFESEAFRSATVDGLWLSAPVATGEADEAPLRRRLEALGAVHVEVVEDAS